MKPSPVRAIAASVALQRTRSRVKSPGRRVSSTVVTGSLGSPASSSGMGPTLTDRRQSGTTKRRPGCAGSRVTTGHRRYIAALRPAVGRAPSSPSTPPRPDRLVELFGHVPPCRRAQVVHVLGERPLVELGSRHRRHAGGPQHRSRMSDGPAEHCERVRSLRIDIELEECRQLGSHLDAAAAPASAVATRCGSNGSPASIRRLRTHRSTQPATARSVLVNSSVEYSSTSRLLAQHPDATRRDHAREACTCQQGCFASAIRRRYAESLTGTTGADRNHRTSIQSASAVMRVNVIDAKRYSSFELRTARSPASLHARRRRSMPISELRNPMNSMSSATTARERVSENNSYSAIRMWPNPVRSPRRRRAREVQGGEPRPGGIVENNSEYHASALVVCAQLVSSTRSNTMKPSDLARATITS